MQTQYRFFPKHLYHLSLEKGKPTLCSPWILPVYFSDGHNFEKFKWFVKIWYLEPHIHSASVYKLHLSVVSVLHMTPHCSFCLSTLFIILWESQLYRITPFDVRT